MNKLSSILKINNMETKINKNLLTKDLFEQMKKLDSIRGVKLVFDHTDLNLYQSKQYYDTYKNEQY